MEFFFTPYKWPYKVEVFLGLVEWFHPTKITNDRLGLGPPKIWWKLSHHQHRPVEKLVPKNKPSLWLRVKSSLLFLFKHMERLVELQGDHSGFLMVESYCWWKKEIPNNNHRLDGAKKTLYNNWINYLSLNWWSPDFWTINWGWKMGIKKLSVLGLWTIPHCGGTVEVKISPSWWLNQPIWKTCLSNGILSLRIRSENKTYLSCHHVENGFTCWAFLPSCPGLLEDPYYESYPGENFPTIAKNSPKCSQNTHNPPCM